MSDPARIRNVTTTDACPWCEDGLAISAWRNFGKGRLPEYAPCPHCEKGAAIEFQTGVQTKAGCPPIRPRWPNGYWQGRDPVVERRPRDGAILPYAENMVRFQLLSRRLQGADVDPCIGLDMTDPKRRLEMAKRALAGLA